MSEFSSAAEAACRLGIPPTTFRGWIKKGLVPRVKKMSNIWLVPDDLTLEEVDIPEMGRPPKKSNGEGHDDIQNQNLL